MGKCPRCYGKGTITCNNCRGKGRRGGGILSSDYKCPTCNGSGEVRCPNCNGKGWIN